MGFATHFRSLDIDALKVCRQDFKAPFFLACGIVFSRGYTKMRLHGTIPVGEWGSKCVMANWRLPHCWLLVLVGSVRDGMLSVANQEIRKEPFEMIELRGYLFGQWIGVWNCPIEA
jgi:hypothetical protein